MKVRGIDLDTFPFLWNGNNELHDGSRRLASFWMGTIERSCKHYLGDSSEIRLELFVGWLVVGESNAWYAFRYGFLIEPMLQQSKY